MEYPLRGKSVQKLTQIDLDDRITNCMKQPFLRCYEWQIPKGSWPRSQERNTDPYHNLTFFCIILFNIILTFMSSSWQWSHTSAYSD